MRTGRQEWRQARGCTYSNTPHVLLSVHSCGHCVLVAPLRGHRVIAGVGHAPNKVVGHCLPLGVNDILLVAILLSGQVSDCWLPLQLHGKHPRGNGADERYGAVHSARPPGVPLVVEDLGLLAVSIPTPACQAACSLWGALMLCQLAG